MRSAWSSAPSQLEGPVAPQARPAVPLPRSAPLLLAFRLQPTAPLRAQQLRLLASDVLLLVPVPLPLHEGALPLGLWRRLLRAGVPLRGVGPLRPLSGVVLLSLRLRPQAVGVQPHAPPLVVAFPCPAGGQAPPAGLSRQHLRRPEPLPQQPFVPLPSGHALLLQPALWPPPALQASAARRHVPALALLDADVRLRVHAPTLLGECALLRAHVPTLPDGAALLRAHAPMPLGVHVPLRAQPPRPLVALFPQPRHVLSPNVLLPQRPRPLLDWDQTVLRWLLQPLPRRHRSRSHQGLRRSSMTI